MARGLRVRSVNRVDEQSRRFLKTLSRHWPGRQTAVVLAGRTDEGVHAAGQVAGVADVRPDWQASRYEVALNALLPDDCGFSGSSGLRQGFTPGTMRAGANIGTESGLVRANRWPDRCLAATWSDRCRSDQTMERAGSIGTHDFASFAGGGEGVPWSDRQSAPRGTVRTIMICNARTIDPWWGPAGAGELDRAAHRGGWVLAADGAHHRGCADGDRPATPRSGLGRCPACRSRSANGRRNGPAHGLTLWRVGYAGDVPEIDAAGVSGNAGASLETRMK